MKNLKVYSLLTRSWQQSDLSSEEMEAHKASNIASNFWGEQVETVLPLADVPAECHPYGEQFEEIITPEQIVDPVMGPDPEWVRPDPEIDPETNEPIPWEVEPTAPIIELEAGYTIPAETRQMIRFPWQYVMIETDTTAENQAVQKQQKRIAFENFGKDFKRWVQILNEDSGVTPAQVLAIRADPRMKTANELAEGGDIPTLKYHIEQTDWTGLFPAPVVTQALTKIDGFLAGWE